MHTLNAPRRLEVAAGVVVAGAAVGTLSGVLMASAMMTTRLGHVTPDFAGELIRLGSQTGAAAGVLIGAPVTFTLLRRAPLSHIATDVFLAATYGGLLGFASSFVFAQPRPTVALVFVGSCAGVVAAAARLWSRFRHVTAEPIA